MSAAEIIQADAIQNKRDKRRQFITPEGVDLELAIASSGLRFAALIVDLTLILILLIALSLLAWWMGVGGAGMEMAAIIWLLGFFALRTFWFIGFELGQRAATPGKRIVGIRVVARDGGRLTADAVIARNLIRELEIFLPFTFLGAGASEDLVGWGTSLAGAAWTLTLGFFLLFNRDRMRMGDLIAGTWVVQAGRAKLSADLAATSVPDEALSFTDAELSVYGVYELQELERVLRVREARQIEQVADAIRAKIGRQALETDEDFLEAYYRQLRTRLERGLLFGKRRANKYVKE
jgi:uncharacterized RDD family membrane protein YckC